MPPKRMTANPVRPARYRAGKAVAEVESSEEEDSDAEDLEHRQETKGGARSVPPKATSFPAGKQATSNLKSVDLAERKRQAEVEERKRLAEERARTAQEERDAGFVTESESEKGGDGAEGSGSSEEDESESEDSSEEESDSSEDRPARQLLRPKFVPKSQRKVETSAEAAAAKEEQMLADEEARKKEIAESYVKDRIERDAAARAAGKKNWDDDEVDEEGAVDDTDGLNPELERKAWIARELSRLKRSRDALEEREKEIAELDRRRNLTAEERDAEDRKHVAKQEEERKNRGQMAHMQRYHHRGAFFADESEQKGLLDRNIMSAEFEDQQKSRDAMPEYLQVRDATKIGKKGRTRYKDMKSEDTGRWGDHLRDDRRPRRDGPGFNDVTDERFRPDTFRPREGATGANAGPLGERKRTGPVGDSNDSKRPRFDR